MTHCFEQHNSLGIVHGTNNTNHKLVASRERPQELLADTVPTLFDRPSIGNEWLSGSEPPVFSYGGTSLIHNNHQLCEQEASLEE